MKPIPEAAIRLEFPFTIWDRVWASLVLTPQRKFALVIHFIFPLAGLFLLWLLLTSPRSSNLLEYFLVAVCLAFTPLITFFVVLNSHLTNKMFREPFTYLFDDEGIHVHAASYQYSNPWPAITLVKPLGGFLMFFFAPGAAHAIPLKVIRSANQYEPLLSLLRANGVKVTSGDMGDNGSLNIS